MAVTLGSGLPPGATRETPIQDDRSSRLHGTGTNQRLPPYGPSSSILARFDSRQSVSCGSHVMRPVMAAPEPELLALLHIPPGLRAAGLRAHFSQFLEAGGFTCFHYRHRPQGGPGGRRCCLLSVRPDAAPALLRMYSGRPWTGPGGAVLGGPPCEIRRVQAPPAETADCCTFPYKTKKQLQSKQAGSEVFTQLDLQRLPELNPPPLMPQGNVGTPTRVFLELIQSCRLPPRIITKLQLQFPRTGSGRRYSRVPFEYHDSETVEQQEEGVYTASGTEIPHMPGAIGGEDSKDPGAAVPEETPADPEEQESEVGGESHSDDDNDTCEEWERHEALHEDVTNQGRTEERLFEEKIELKWEKGGSGLVFYTDAQYWHAEEGDFDEQTADDWDVDMSIYYDQGAGDKDARDSVQMRLERRRRDGFEDDERLGKPLGTFERHTKVHEVNFAEMALLLGLLLTAGSLTGVSALVASVTCSMDGVVVSASLQDMSSEGYQTFFLQTDQDPQCIGSVDGNLLRVSISGAAFLHGECGLNFTSLNGSVTVNGILHLVADTPSTSRDLPVSCTFIFNILGHVESSGNRPQATMSLFTDSAYMSPESGALALGKHVFVMVQLEGANEEDIVLVLETCYATASASPYDANRISLLQNGTSIPGHLSTEVLQNGNSNQAKFAFKMFKFKEQPSDIYLHCDVYVCVQSSGHCHRERRRRRSAPNSHRDRRMTVSQGPFSYYEE